MYPWWQSLLFFCAITCSIAQRERSLSNDSLNVQTIDDSFFKIIRLLMSPDVQHPVSQIPTWKSRVISYLLKRYPVSGQYGNLPRSQKWYSRRLFRRAAENPDEFMTAFKSAIKEALREILAENRALSPQSDTSALWSKNNENTGSLSSDAEVHSLRSIGFRANDLPSDSVQPSLKNDTSVPAQAAKIWSTMRSPFTSSKATSSERVSLKSQPALQMQPSVTALPAGRTPSYYSDMTSTEKSKTYTEVTTAPGSSKAFNLRLLTSSYSRSSEINLNPITKDPFTMAANVVFENSTLRNILTSNFKSAEKLGSVVLPITEKSSTSDLIVTIAAGQFSPDGKTSSQIKHSIPQNDHTISPILVSSHSTFKIPRPSVGKAFATSVSFTPKNRFANSDQITSTKEKPMPSLSMRSTSMTAAITSKMTIQSDLAVPQISSTYKSTSAGTSEGALANTAGTLISTLSSPKHISSTEGNHVSTEAVSFETDYEMPSSVTPLPNMASDHEACILKVRNATTTVPTPLENESTVSSARIRTSIHPKSDAPYTGPLASTELASTVALSPFTDSYSTDQKENASFVPLNYLAGTHSPEPPKLDPTATVSSFTDTFPVSPESTTLPNTETPSLPDYEIFQDAINGNENSDQTTSLVTNTMSSTVLPFWFSKSLTSVTPLWKYTSPFFQRERSTALQITPQSQANLGPTPVTSTVSRYSTSPSVLNTAFTISQLRNGTSPFFQRERSTALESTPQSQANLGPTRVTSIVSRYSTSPSVLNTEFTISQLRNGTTIRHLGSTNTSGVFTSKMPQSKTNGQSYNISSMPPKSSILYSSTYITPQSQAISSTTHMRSAESQSLIFTASQSRNKTTTDINSLFTVSHLDKTSKTHINSTSATYKTSQTSTAITWKHQSSVAPSKSATSDLPHSKSTTRVILTERTERRLTVAKRQSYSVSATTLTSGVFSTRIHGNTSEAPAFKIWIPQSSDGIPTKSTTSSFTASKGLGEIQTTYNTTLSSISVLVAMPLTFHLTGVSYSMQLGNHTTDEYKRLEREVILVLNKVFASKYQQEYVQAEILGFSNGSVVVQTKLAFNSGSSAPSASDIVRTVLSDNIAIKNNYFGWNINASTVQSKGYTIKNLQQESFSISFVVLHFGFIATSHNDQKKQSYLESLQKEVLLAVNTTFPVTKVTFSQIRNLYGDLEVRGNLYLQSSMFTNVQDLLSTLLPLVNVSVDLSSINVDGMHKELKVYPFNFLLTNMQFAIKLLNMASDESQKLSKDLSKMIELALYDKSLLQVVVREFSSGSVVCKGDLIYQFPAPGSGEILRQFLRALTSDGVLGSSTYKVDFQSITIGDSTSSPYNEYTNFPGYAVAIIVMCGLTILLLPLLVYVCHKTRMLGHRRKATIRQRHDPDQQSHRLEMDNRAFRASIEQP